MTRLMRVFLQRIAPPSRLRALAAVVAVCAAATLASPASATERAPAGLRAPASQVEPPPNFWRSAREAIAIADRQPVVRRALLEDPRLRGRAYVADLGLWLVVYGDAHRYRAQVQVEDRTGDVLELSPYAYPRTGARTGSANTKVELICLALTILLLATFFDFRRPLRLRNADLLALLSLGAAVALFDRGQPLVAVPLVYPPLVYLFGRLAWLGFRRTAGDDELTTWASERMLLVGLVALVLGRIAANLLIGGVGDVGYASVFGANSIHDGWPLYVRDHSHLDTYGPVTYLAYLPFEALFPLKSWKHDYLPAAHAATIAFDLLTTLGLFALGRRLRAGRDGRRLGLMLAFAWVACPFTFLTLAGNTNDGLVPLLVVGALLALGSPARRGILLGLAAAAKFGPLALAALFARPRGDRGRGPVVFAFCMAAAIALPVLVYAGGDLGVFWDETLGFQLHRHSFLSIWGQYPQLHPIQVAAQAGAVCLALAAAVSSRRRSGGQVAALSGAILIGLQLVTAHWYFFYVVWFVPGVLVALLAIGREREPRRTDGVPLLEEIPLTSASISRAPAAASR